MKISILIIIILLSSLFMPVFGQTSSDAGRYPIKYKYAIGAGAGFTTGYGLSFKFTPNKFGIQTTFGSITYYESSKWNLGLTFLWSLLDSEYAILYLYQGNNYRYYYKSDYRGVISNKEINFGVGMGVEAIVLKRIGLNVMYGYGFYDNFDRSFLTGELGIYYKF